MLDHVRPEGADRDGQDGGGRLQEGVQHADGHRLRAEAGVPQLPPAATSAEVGIDRSTG